MTPAGMDVQTRGRWYDKDRNWYSNLNWVPYKSVWSRDPYTQYFADKTPVSKEHEYAEDWDTWAEKWLEANVPQSARLTQLKAQHEARRRALAEQAKLSEADKETAWENYLRDKYGSEVADAVESDKLYEEIDASDMDTISEDPELVNSILARQMLG
jgi:hypothetical protein